MKGGREDVTNLVLLSIKWNWVRTRLLCLNILKKVLIWSDVTIEERMDKQTNKQGKIELLSQWTMDGWDEQWLDCKTPGWDLFWKISNNHFLFNFFFMESGFLDKVKHFFLFLGGRGAPWILDQQKIFGATVSSNLSLPLQLSLFPPHSSP